MEMLGLGFAFLLALIAIGFAVGYSFGEADGFRQGFAAGLVDDEEEAA